MLSRSYQRSPQELRPIKIVRHYTKYAPGSVLIAYGDTRVLVTASVEERVPKHVLLANQASGTLSGWLTAEYSMLPGATETRNQRDRLKVSGRTTEIQRLIGRSLRASLDLSKLGQRTLTLDADVLQADGGTRVASITGAYIAMADALAKLQSQGLLAESPIISPVAAVSVGVVNGVEVLDLDYSEDSQADVDANVVMNGKGEFIEFQATSEHRPFSRQTMDELMALAGQGIDRLLQLQQEALQSDALTVEVV